MEEVRIKLCWKVDDRIRGILAEYSGDIDVEPGYMLSCGDRNYVILRILRKEARMLRAEVLADSEISGFCTLQLSEGDGPLVSIRIDVDDWVIASLRMLGFKISRKLDEAEVILTDHLQSLPDEALKVVIPKKGANLDADLGGVRFSSRKIRGFKEEVITFPAINARTVIPQGVVSYPLSVAREDAYILGEYSDGTPAAAYVPKTNTLYLSTEMLLVAYDVIKGKGAASRAIAWMLTIKPDAFRREGKVPPLPILGERFIRTELKDSISFRSAVDALLEVGGFLKKRDDSALRARVSLPYLAPPADIDIWVRDGKVGLKVIGNEAIRDFVEGLIVRKLRAVEMGEKKAEELRMLLTTAFNALERMVGVVDALEVKMGKEAIAEEMDDIIAILEALPALNGVVELLEVAKSNVLSENYSAALAGLREAIRVLKRDVVRLVTKAIKVREA